MLHVSLVLPMLYTVSLGTDSGWLESSNQYWDYFTFAQSWPTATCALAPLKNHTCHIDRKVTTWTVHGLWPADKGAKKNPAYCNATDKFDLNEIADIEGSLNVYWPDLYNATPSTGLWAHEWKKHGTCCLDLKTTSGEHNYFSTGLNLNRKFDILRILKENRIVPSTTQKYKMTAVNDAIHSTIGVEPWIHCLKYVKRGNDGKTTAGVMLSQVDICLTKDLTPMVCPSKIYKDKDSLEAHSWNRKILNPKTDRLMTSCPHTVYYPPITYV